ncbi:hypothetical protein N9J08_01950 [Hellea sp.]|nr:hypothetical protein [Hellea sp.]MDA8997083.1 hypothetical protein [Hellea sp.]
MADTKTLEDLKNVIEGTDTVSTITDSTVLPEPKIDDLGRIILKITNGLSIKGTNYPSGIHLTNQNMGSVFNKGLIAVTLEEESRIILLSLKHIENEALELIKPS